MSDNTKNFMGQFWITTDGGIITMGLNEEALADFDEIVSFDLPSEQDNVDEEEVCGGIETSDGPIDLYSPVTGTVVEVNTAIVEDPSVLMEDPYGEGWLLKFVADEEEEFDEDDDEDEEDEDEDEDDED